MKPLCTKFLESFDITRFFKVFLLQIRGDKDFYLDKYNNESKIGVQFKEANRAYNASTTFQ